jgi:protein AIR1/2
MTSSAVVEIIDLTDNTQNIPKSETSEADADPEKNTTRAVHKRKNGEAGTANSRVRSSHPVKSRRVSVERERDRVQPDEGTESQRAEDTQGKDGESARKKRRRSKKNKDGEKDKDPAGPSSREDAQQDALLALDDDRLFFVDTEPTSVPTGMAFVPNDDPQAAQSSSRTSEADKVPLLLPPHVSVPDPGGDLPVQIVPAADSDSDAESYIEYIDYDDRLVRR